jgi:hypothetical protein
MEHFRDRKAVDMESLDGVVRISVESVKTCASAACLALAYRDSERDETEDGTRSKQAA